jgi:uncharacterized protein (DUF1684 family)
VSVRVRAPTLRWFVMRTSTITITAILLSTAAIAATKTPEQTWKADLADTNLAYTTRPHAILKIQDAAYLGEGNRASLAGTKGKPGSYKWVSGAVANPVLVASYRDGKLAMTRGGKPVANAMADIPIDKDVDLQAFPTQVQAGVMGVRIFVYNQKNPAIGQFHGVDYFPYDASYVVKASFKADTRMPARDFMTSRKTSKQFYHAGDAMFVLQGKALTLPLYADARDPRKLTEMSAFFTDKLTGKGTYGAGRYVDAGNFGKFPPKSVTLDFNYAYNPNCARSPFYTCPVAVDDLSIAVKAGERDPHATH